MWYLLNRYGIKQSRHQLFGSESLGSKTDTVPSAQGILSKPFVKRFKTFLNYKALYDDYYEIKKYHPSSCFQLRSSLAMLSLQIIGTGFEFSFCMTGLNFKVHLGQKTLFNCDSAQKHLPHIW